MTPQPPPVLYKYRSLSGDAFKYTQDIFMRRRIYLPMASSLNDPWEGVCNAYSVPNPSAGESSGTYALLAMEMNRRSGCGDARIGCFTALNDHPLMWAHYSDSHRGICIGFSTSIVTELSEARPVTYQQDVPRVHAAYEGSSKAYLSKHTAWIYEEEWRILGARTQYVAIPPHGIECVILGARISDADKDWVRDWIAHFGGGVRVLAARFSTSQYSVKLTQVNLDK